MWSSIWSSIIAIHTWLCAYAFGRWRFFFFFSSRRRHTRCSCDWSSDVCSSDLVPKEIEAMSAVLSKGTITDLLRYINQDEHVRRDNEFYMSLAQFAGNGEYPGPDLLAA